MSAATQPRPPALLVAGSLGLAERAAVSSWGWHRFAQGRYRTPDGEEVQAVPDESQTGFLGRPPGTRCYLGPGWHRRADIRTVNHLLHSGALVEADPPNSAGR